MCSTYDLNQSTNGDKEDGGYGGPYSKKQKRQKVAKRGPGVAELEKLLREQEQENEGFSLFPSFSNSHQPSNVHPPSNNCAWKNIHPFGLNPNHCGISSKSGHLVLSDPKLISKMWMSDEASGFKEEGSGSAFKLPFLFCSRNEYNGDYNEVSHFSTLKGKDQCYPQRSCVFSDVSELKVSSTSSTPPHSGQSNGLEPPSNQTSAHHLTFVLPEEEKKDGSRSSHQIYKGIPFFPPFSHQVPTFPSTACKSKDNNFHIEPTETASRNADSGCYYVPNFRNCDTNCGIPDDKLLKLGSSATPRWNENVHHQKESKLNFLSFHKEHLDESQRRPGLKTECQKGFISFLLPVDHVETESKKCCSLSNERVETNAEGIDLDLRL